SSISAAPGGASCAITKTVSRSNILNWPRRQERIMAIDRTVRSLSSLAGASSSRVLNLLAIGQAQAENEGHLKAPLFESPIINHSIILKHRLRADELDLFPIRRVLATKVIIPFERTDLRVGGRSLFVGQQGYDTLLREAGN